MAKYRLPMRWHSFIQFAQHPTIHIVTYSSYSEWKSDITFIIFGFASQISPLRARTHADELESKSRNCFDTIKCYKLTWFGGTCYRYVCIARLKRIILDSLAYCKHSKIRPHHIWPTVVLCCSTTTSATFPLRTARVSRLPSGRVGRFGLARRKNKHHFTFNI